MGWNEFGQVNFRKRFESVVNIELDNLERKADLEMTRRQGSVAWTGATGVVVVGNGMLIYRAYGTVLIPGAGTVCFRRKFRRTGYLGSTGTAS